MTVFSINEGDDVELEFSGRRLEGEVLDVRWAATWSNPRSEIIVDADVKTQGEFVQGDVVDEEDARTVIEDIPGLASKQM